MILLNSLLTRTLDKTIKLWKVYERSLKTVSESSMMMTDIDSVPGNFGRAVQTSLTIPKISHRDTVVAATPRRIYSNGNKKSST
jgi:serine/threonine-protein phosphatase 2A regulatory subunit B